MKPIFKKITLGFAQTVVTIPNPLKTESVEELLNAITNFIFWVGMALAPIILIIAGFMYVTSAGDTKRMETAKNMIKYAIIGLALLLLARGLVVVLESILGVSEVPPSGIGLG